MTPLDVALNRMAEIRTELAELETFVRVYYRMFPQERLASKTPTIFKGYRSEADLREVSEPVDNSVDNSVDNPSHGHADDGAARDQASVVGAHRFKLKRAREIFRDVFERHIRARGKPLTRIDLLNLIEEDPNSPPLPEGTQDEKAKYLGTLLWRNRDQFKNLSGYGYWLKSEDYAPAGYHVRPDDLLHSKELEMDQFRETKPSQEIIEDYKDISMKIDALDMEDLFGDLTDKGAEQRTILREEKQRIEDIYPMMQDILFTK